GNWAFTVQKSDASVLNPKRTAGITMQTLLARWNLKRINILKIDIEGTEKKLFENNTEWLNSVDSIIIKLHNKAFPGTARNFYAATPDFKNEWSQGELTYVYRNDFAITPE